ncbi:IS110 family transposase, partial [Streptomyces sp. SID4923]|nr:IS110 family transposase [Streptomyces sp. SID4923]
MTTDFSQVGRLFVMWMWRSVPKDGRVEHDRRTHVIETGDIDVFLG